MNETIEEPLNENKLKLIFNDLKYTTNKNKVIINKLNGELVSGQFTAILGPSGSGKTTLIECIANKRKAGVSGNIFFNQNNSNKTNIRIAYNSQKDALIDLLTVEECLLYASQLRDNKDKKYDFFNAKQTDSYHYKNESFNGNSDLNAFPDKDIERKLIEKKFRNKTDVRNIIEVFGLNQCSNVRAINCSGGQRKRLSIALELMFSPNILLLDEPTSGLDSVSCLQCVSLLNKLAKNRDPIIIAASVHQPSAKILTYFDHIYVLSIYGNCVYNGPTDQLIEHLSSFHLLCPIYHNPADYVLEIASAVHGKDSIERLVAYEENKWISRTINSDKNKFKTKEYSCNSSMKEQIINMWILLKRCTLLNIRNPFMFWLKLLGCVLSLGTKFVVYHKSNVGQREGCLNTTSITKTFIRMTTRTGFEFNRSNWPNIAYLLTIILFTHILTLGATLMSFPIELSVFVKEHFNKWYTNWSYFMAKSLADIPSVLIFPLIYATLLYIITNQSHDMWRFTAHILIVLLFALLSHSLGLFLSAFYINRINAALITFGIIFIPSLLFCGFIIPINKMPAFLRPLSYISLFRLPLEALIIVMYGFGRCQQTVIDINIRQLSKELDLDLYYINECFSESNSFPNITLGIQRFNTFLSNRSPSQVLEFLSIEENSFKFDIILMIFYTILFRVMAYYVLKWKVKVK